MTKSVGEALTKEEERAELHKAIWGIADNLREEQLRREVEQTIKELGE